MPRRRRLHTSWQSVCEESFVRTKRHRCLDWRVLGRSYELSVLDSAGIWYNGRLVIAREDTLTLRGFEKGRDYPSRYNITPNDTMLRGQVFFMAIGLNADTVEMTSFGDDTLRLPPQMLLFKRRKEQ